MLTPRPDTPWEATWMHLPPPIRSALEQEDITHSPADAPSFVALWERYVQGKGAVMEAVVLAANSFRLRETQKQEDADRASPSEADTSLIVAKLTRLYQAAKATRRFGQSTTSMDHWLLTAAAPMDHARAAEASLPAQGPKHTYRPRKTANADTTTQQDKDKADTRKWADRLLAALRPHPLPYLLQSPHYEDKIALLGTTRAATLRTHALAMEKTLSHYPEAIIWQEGEGEMARVTHMLRTLREQGCKPSRLQKAWKTLNWVCRTMGYPPPDEHKGLLAAYKSAQSRLERPLYKKSRKAKMPPDEVVTALEKGACDPNKPGAYRYYASMLRLQLGVSARYVDMQHTAPSTLMVHSRHIHMAPWQTKTTRKGATNLTRFVATKHSRANLNWWEAAEATCTKFNEVHPDMDFMYPRLNPEKTSYVLQPASHSQVQTMYRHILATQGVTTPVANSMSLHGLRVWAAEMAYQAQVPRDLRRYIGHWSQEKTADTYTREHARIVTQIWGHIFENYDRASGNAREDVPEDPAAVEFLDHLGGAHDVHLIKFNLAERRGTPAPKRPKTGPSPTSPIQAPLASDHHISPDSLAEALEHTATPGKTQLAPTPTHPDTQQPGEHTHGDADPTTPRATGAAASPRSEAPPMHLPPTSPASTGNDLCSPRDATQEDDVTLPDIDDHPLGPLTVARGHLKTKGLYRIHYVMPNLRTVGCNKLANPAKYMWIHSAQDYADLEDIQECHWCGSKARLPETWTTITAEPRLGEEEESTTSASDSSDSGSASTDSDALEVEA